MQGIRVVFFTVADLVDLVPQDLKEDRLERRLHALCKPKWLILDEMGDVPVDQRSAQFLFRLMSRRSQKGSILLTSNTSSGEWGDVVSDCVLASAMLDRLLHYSTTMNIRGERYRLREKRKAGVFHDLTATPAKSSSSASRKTPGEKHNEANGRDDGLEVGEGGTAFQSTHVLGNFLLALNGASLKFPTLEIFEMALLRRFKLALTR